MSLAKIDHVIWKVNTYLSVGHKKRAMDFVDHHNCRLGKWYYDGEGAQYFSKMPSFRDLELPHDRVHSATKKIFDFIEDSGNTKENIQPLIKDMEDASTQVFDILDRVLAEKCR